MIKRMDTSLASYAALCRKTFPNVDAGGPGTGAAGGLGFAFQTFLSASLEPGIQIVLDETRLRDDVRDADLVITGEGQLDGQTVMGEHRSELQNFQKNTANLSLRSQAVLQKMHLHATPPELMPFPDSAERRFTRRSCMEPGKMRQKI